MRYTPYDIPAPEMVVPPETIHLYVCPVCGYEDEL